ncbi:MAG: hypothetical protein JW776_05465 [Candidatus Lokiarchaeota archaeon]|nr:hypothetical protein [Candidatus Lokiarchaeota archaeon]
MTEVSIEENRPKIIEFIEATFFQSLNVLPNELVKLEREEITMKQFRAFILEQRVWFAERVLDYWNTTHNRETQLENTLLHIGKELQEEMKAND